ESLTLQLNAAARDSGVPVTILGVMVFGSPYAEDVESRRRMRYAVLSGLAERHYVPDNPGALGYIATAAEGDGVRVPEVVPYEWFTFEPPQLAPKEPKRGSLRKETSLKEIPPPRQKLLVLWLDE